MKGRDVLKSMVDAGGRAKPEASTPPVPHRPAGAVKAMNLSLGRLNEEAAAARALREAIATGDRIIEISPDLIDDSIFRDRLELEEGDAYADLRRSIEEKGQQVPVLVRPSSGDSGRYQIAYGHRRVSVLRKLERPVRAIVRVLSDQEMVLAQGQENSDRIDLSFIERARYAREMEKFGFSRELIASILSIDKPETSRLLQVAEVVPNELIEKIGPAPKVGRPRWLALANKLGEAKPGDAALPGSVKATLTGAGFNTLDTNKRFEQVWAALNEHQRSGKDPEPIRSRKGYVLGTYVKARRGAKLTILNDDFAAFLTDRMGSLVEEFETKNVGETNG